MSTSSELECYDIRSAGRSQYVPSLRDCIESGTSRLFNGRREHPAAALGARTCRAAEACDGRRLPGDAGQR